MARTDDNALVPVFGVYGQNSAPTMAADLTEIAANAAQVEAAEVAALADLPATGNWVKRTIWVDEVNEPRWWDGAKWRGALNDTGWVTTGLAITPGSGFDLVGYELCRVGVNVSGVVTLKRTGATVTPDSSGNFADIVGALTMPVGWRYSGTTQDVFLTVQQSGVASFFARLRRSGVGADGQMDITHGIPAQTLPNGQNISFTLNYRA